jgi:hypothetical protein
MKYFALFAALLLALACGSKNTATPFAEGGAAGTFATGATGGRQVIPGSGGSGGASGGSGGATTGGEAGEADTELGPDVQITSPLPVSDPETGTVLTGSQIAVTCTVTKSTATGAAGILASSITIQMFGADGKQIGADGSVLSTANANEYGATFVLTSVPTGALSFSCSASDQATVAHTSTATVNTFYDGGPAITLINPQDGSAHPLSPLDFKFSALPATLAAVDPGADVASVTMTVNAVAISPLTPIDGMSGSYESSVDLNDPKVFAATPVGIVPITITATNKRGTTATSKYTFVVDSTGPTIQIVSPPPVGVHFIGGQVTIEFTAVDEANGSGVDPSTLSVIVNTSAPSLYVPGDTSWVAKPDGKTFDYSFSTVEYSTQYQIGVIVGGADKAGNKAQGANAQYYVDNSPPIVDLQPGLLQEEDNGPSYICSAPFDPLGVSPHDLDIVHSVNTFRALVWDQGNVPDGVGATFYSGIDNGAGVRLYFQADPSAPLLKNKAGTAGGLCDDVADLSLPFASLTPAAPFGTPYHPANAPTISGCSDGTDTSPPTQTACGNNSDLVRVIAHDDAPQVVVPVIYGVQVDTGGFCTGSPLGLTTKVAQDGWVCAAVVAQDNIGNRAVSAPIRLCLDATEYSGSPPCATQSTTPPTCVGAAPNNCTPPGHFPYKVIQKPIGT